jgi:transforming growth factor-beta-induced protein
MKKNRRIFLLPKATIAGVLLFFSSTSWSQTNVYDDIIALSPDHSTLKAAIDQQGLQGALQDNSATLTVFAPTNQAFANLFDALGITESEFLANSNLTDQLLYHVFDGGIVTSSALTNGQLVQPMFVGNIIKITVTSTNEVYANHALVELPNIPADNGVVHSIDAVLLSDFTVVDVALADQANFSTLTTAVITAELLPVLTDPFASLTVFAPTNDAFNDALASLNLTAAQLLASPDLASILTYHVLDAEVLSGTLTNGQLATPINNANTLKITVTSTDEVFVNQAQVTTPDVPADNGVVHVLDAVVLPVETVVDIALADQANFSTLTTAVITAELLPALTDPFASLTVFAPTNDAFNDALAALNLTAAQLLASPDLASILTYHVLDAEVLSGTLTNGQLATPINNANTLKITVTSTDEVFVNQAQVTTPDVPADNGVVHVLDAVVLPVETVVDIALADQANFSTLTTAVITAELLPALTDPFASLTVFAPTNDAFNDALAALNLTAAQLLASPDLASILTYHVLDAEVLSGTLTNGQLATPINNANTLKITVTSTDEVFVNQAQVTTPDVPADNGVVHVLDAVVLPVETVVDVAIDNSFTSLTAAVVTAELLPVLTDPFSEFTVFAPTNDAFDDLATTLGTDLNGVLASPNLTDILLYHVISGTVLSGDLTAGPVATVGGENVIIDLTNGVKVNDASVTIADLEVDNGVVHVIDAVLLPITLSIADEIIMNLSLYPNPAVDVVRLNNANGSSFEIIDMMGVRVAAGIMLNDEINISSLANGTYLVKVINNGQAYQSKLVKQ